MEEKRGRWERMEGDGGQGRKMEQKGGRLNSREGDGTEGM